MTKRVRKVFEDVKRARREVVSPTTNLLGSPDVWLREAERWAGEGYPNIAQTYRDLAALAAERAVEESAA